MSRVSDASRNGKALIPFVTAGDPNPEITERLTLAIAEVGVNLVEIGIPFSDSIAEGIVIQEADMRALASGTTTDKIFEMVKRIREGMDILLAFMTYINPVFVYGAERFLAKCEGCGVDVLIVPDMLSEEKQELLPYCYQYDTELISLIAPTSREQITAIAREAEGFVYRVSPMGMTGVRTEITMDTGEMVSPVKKENDIPCAIGFGISTPEQAKKMVASVDGVIVGSAIVRIAAQYGMGCIASVCDYAKVMKAAISWHRYKYIIIPASAHFTCQ